MTELDFDFLRVLLQRRSGLYLSTEKRYLVESRLGMLCRRRGIAGIPTLVTQLRGTPSSELRGGRRRGDDDQRDAVLPGPHPVRPDP